MGLGTAMSKEKEMLCFEHPLPAKQKQGRRELSTNALRLRKNGSPASEDHLCCKSAQRRTRSDRVVSCQKTGETNATERRRNEGGVGQEKEPVKRLGKETLTREKNVREGEDVPLQALMVMIRFNRNIKTIQVSRAAMETEENARTEGRPGRGS